MSRVLVLVPIFYILKSSIRFCVGFLCWFFVLVFCVGLIVEKKLYKNKFIYINIYGNNIRKSHK